MWLGAHVGIAGGMAEAPVVGRRIGCEAIQIFSKSPQMWNGSAIPAETAAGFAGAVAREGLRSTAVHQGYLVNLASPKKPMLERSRAAFVDEIQRAELLGVDHLIFHPGAHMTSGVETGLASIVESINWAFQQTPGAKVRTLLENAAGQGTTLGTHFTELRTVLDGVEDRARVGVALDTCHLFAAGNDFREASQYGALMDRIDSELGLEEVRAFHLNDAKAELGSHLDRHENIGKGQIGVAGFSHFVNDPRWASTPGYLETPLDDNDYALYEADLATLRGLVGSTGRKPTPSSKANAGVPTKKSSAPKTGSKPAKKSAR